MVSTMATSQSDQTPLMYASLFGREPVVSKLLDEKADIHVRDMFGTTALMHACACSNARIVKQLLEAGADIDAVDKNGKTAFDIAQASGNTEIASMLENARIRADETVGSAFSP